MLNNFSKGQCNKHAPTNYIRHLRFVHFKRWTQHLHIMNMSEFVKFITPSKHLNCRSLIVYLAVM